MTWTMVDLKVKQGARYALMYSATLGSRAAKAMAEEITRLSGQPVVLVPVPGLDSQFQLVRMEREV